MYQKNPWKGPLHRIDFNRYQLNSMGVTRALSDYPCIGMDAHIMLESLTDDETLCIRGLFSGKPRLKIRKDGSAGTHFRIYTLDA